jgi:hypothetical protein
MQVKSFQRLDRMFLQGPLVLTIVRPEGFEPAVKGEPTTAESAPVSELMAYAEIVLPAWFVT